MQLGFCKYVLSKKIKIDIFNNSAFANRKLIVIIYSSPEMCASTSNLELKHSK